MHLKQNERTVPAANVNDEVRKPKYNKGVGTSESWATYRKQVRVERHVLC